jgi:hypothetical protein
VSTFGVTMMRNEIDVCSEVIEHMCWHVDHVIVADNLSTDDTGEELARLVAEGCPLTVVNDTDPRYYQGRKMTNLAMMAMRLGATWVVPFDADEVWSVDGGGRIADYLAGEHGDTLPAAVYNHYCTGVDIKTGSPFTSMPWRTAKPLGLPKVAFRARQDATIRMGNHSVGYTKAAKHMTSSKLRVDHFPYRSPGQFVRKSVQGAAALRLTDLGEDVGAHWHLYDKVRKDQGDQALIDHFYRHFYYQDPVEAGLVCDPAPLVKP